MSVGWRSDLSEKLGFREQLGSPEQLGFGCLETAHV